MTKKIENYLNSENTKEITLFSDGYFKGQSFGITNKDGIAIWYGKFWDEVSSQAAAELETAKKCLWIALQIKNNLNLKIIKLNLFVDAQWLLYQDNPKQKGYALSQISNKNNILLNIQHIYSKENKADKYSRASGYKKLDLQNAIELTLEKNNKEKSMKNIQTREELKIKELKKYKIEDLLNLEFDNKNLDPKSVWKEYCFFEKDELDYLIENEWPSSYKKYETWFLKDYVENKNNLMNYSYFHIADTNITTGIENEKIHQEFFGNFDIDELDLILTTANEKLEKEPEMEI